jgi:hypothetical protein
MVQLVSDNFTRANVNPLGGNWSIPTNGGGGGNQIVSNVCEPTATFTSCTSYWNSITFPSDQYSECTNGGLATYGTNDAQYVYVCTRISSGGTGPTFYAGVFGIEAADLSHYYIVKWINGTQTTLKNGTLSSLNPNDVFRLTVVANALTFAKNGTTVDTATDSSVVSGQPGIQQYAGHTGGASVSDSKISLFAAGANVAKTSQVGAFLVGP